MKKLRPNHLRIIPSVDRMLEWSEVLQLISISSRPFVLALLRKALTNIRQELADGIVEESVTSDIRERILSQVCQEFRLFTQPSLRKTINATGVLLHTNFGRAPLSHEALVQLTDIGGHYSNLEFDLDRATRGKRDVHVDRLLQQILGCQRAIVVNNNAAAIFLTLNTMAEKGEVLISRGELIEIGDSFRIPDILRKSGALLREVGTTNRTKVSDYQDAINESTRLILRVHPSNFRMVGFTSRPSLSELVGLSQASSIPLVEDLGSGCLIDLKRFGIDDEPNPSSNIQAGVHVICFSGDKLLGGPQSGIIAGKAEWIDKIRRNPLFRALRVDKLTLAALEATLLSYLKNRETEEIPLIRMIHLSLDSLEQRAKSILQEAFSVGSKFEFKIIDGTSMIGGGSTPNHGLPTRLISIQCPSVSTSLIESHFRASSPPILTRIENDSVLLDLRTVFPDEDPIVAEALRRLPAQTPLGKYSQSQCQSLDPIQS
jgi:L-seryl-tRNA(Ser) seleniumtransferase